MEDLIRRSDAIKAFKECLETSECGTMLDSDKYYELLLTIPSADRPQGEWVKRTRDMLIAQVNFAYCSECGQPIMHEHTRPLWSFCPNCGARMFAKDTNVPNKKGADDE